MPAFKNRVLQVLDRIYMIVGDQAPNDIQTETPISLVHDVSRQAEFGAGLGPHNGYLTLQNTLTHPGADVQRGRLDPYAYVLNTSWMGFADVLKRQEEIAIWYLGTSLTLSDAAITSATVGMVIDGDTGPGYPYSTGEKVVPLAIYGSATWNFGDMAGTGNVIGCAAINYTTNGVQMVRPLYVPRIGNDKTYITTYCSSSGAMTAWFLHRLWVGPKGSLPPGAG